MTHKSVLAFPCIRAFNCSAPMYLRARHRLVAPRRQLRSEPPLRERETESPRRRCCRFSVRRLVDRRSIKMRRARVRSDPSAEFIRQKCRSFGRVVGLRGSRRWALARRIMKLFLFYLFFFFFRFLAESHGDSFERKL